MESLAKAAAHNRENGGVVMACGMADYAPAADPDIESVFKRADALMYADKIRLKAH